MRWTEHAAYELAAAEEAGRLRRVQDFDAAGPAGRLANERPVVSFASNDYLGLTQHPAVVGAAKDALDRWGAGTGAARLIVGSRPIHSELERELARWKRADAALLFPTGFATNLGVLTALGDADVLICSDELNHASIVDGCRLARARVVVYPHRDMAALSALLNDSPRTIVVSDLVFSMDGDVAPVDDLAELCARHDALLVLDEAHAVLGPDPDLAGVESLRLGTLSKTMGSLGGFAAGSRELIDLLINRARPFIFTTAPPPATAAAALAALRIYLSGEGAGLRARLRGLVDRLAPAHPSPIIPIVIGEERDALRAAARLLEQGYLVPAIRPPSVPPGSARLRVTLSAAHTAEQVQGLKVALEDLVAVRAGA